MSYLTDKLREALDVNQDSTTWSPNNYRAIFLGRNFFCVVKYIGGIKVVNLDLQKVYEEFQRCSSGMRSASMDPIFNERKFSCLEELYVDSNYARVDLVKLFNVAEYVKSLQDARLRAVGYVPLLDGTDKEKGIECKIIDSIKTCFNSNEAKKFGYLYMKDPNKFCGKAPFWSTSANGDITGVQYLNKPNWYKMHSLRPTDYAMDIDGGELWKYFQTYDKLGEDSQGSALKDAFIRELNIRVHNDCNNQFLVALYRRYAKLKAWARDKNVSSDEYAGKLLTRLEVIFDKAKKGAKPIGYLSSQTFKDSVSDNAIANTYLFNEKQKTKPSKYFDAYLDIGSASEEDLTKVRDYLVANDQKVQGNKGLIDLYDVFAETTEFFNFWRSHYAEKTEAAMSKVGVQDIRGSLNDMIPCLKVIILLIEDAIANRKSPKEEASEALVTAIVEQIKADLEKDSIKWLFEYTYYYKRLLNEVIKDNEVYEAYMLKELKGSNLKANRVSLKEVDLNKAIKMLYEKEPALLRHPVFSNPENLKDFYKRVNVVGDEPKEYSTVYPNNLLKDRMGLVNSDKLLSVLAARIYDKANEITMDDTFCKTFLNKAGLKAVMDGSERKLYSMSESDYAQNSFNYLSEEEFKNLGPLSRKHELFIEDACSYNLITIKEMLGKNTN